MKFKNSELTPLLIMLATYNQKDGSMLGGLLSEEMSLGLRRRLQKIREALLPKQAELVKDMEEVNKLPEDQREAEAQKLLDEEVEVEFLPASIEMIEAIKTKVNYDMQLIEKIAQ